MIGTGISVPKAAVVPCVVALSGCLPPGPIASKDTDPKGELRYSQIFGGDRLDAVNLARATCGLSSVDRSKLGATEAELKIDYSGGPLARRSTFECPEQGKDS